MTVTHRINKDKSSAYYEVSYNNKFVKKYIYSINSVIGKQHAYRNAIRLNNDLSNKKYTLFYGNIQ